MLVFDKRCNAFPMVRIRQNRRDMARHHEGIVKALGFSNVRSPDQSSKQDTKCLRIKATVLEWHEGHMCCMLVDHSPWFIEAVAFFTSEVCADDLKKNMGQETPRDSIELAGLFHHQCRPTKLSLVFNIKENDWNKTIPHSTTLASSGHT